MSKEPLSGAQIVLRALVDQGVDLIFGYPGGAVLPIYDALFKQNSICATSWCAKSGGAVHAAEGYARSTGKVGVVLVTSGPGATNAVTGLTDALMDSIPIVCLTGQVPTHLIGNDAFQEADTTGITRPCTKHNYLVKRRRRSGARHARGLLRRAQRAARARSSSTCPRTCCSPRRRIGAAKTETHKSYKPQPQGRQQEDRAGRRSDGQGQAAAVLLRRRRDQFRPDALRSCSAQFVHLTGFPITLTLMGLGALPGLGQAVPRHARHARHLRSQPRDA